MFLSSVLICFSIVFSIFSTSISVFSSCIILFWSLSDSFAISFNISCFASSCFFYFISAIKNLALLLSKSSLVVNLGLVLRLHDLDILVNYWWKIFHLQHHRMVHDTTCRILNIQLLRFFFTTRFFLELVRRHTLLSRHRAAFLYVLSARLLLRVFEGSNYFVFVSTTDNTD